MLRDTLNSDSFVFKEDRGYLVKAIIESTEPSDIDEILYFFTENLQRILTL